jgi:hypothetical protein
MDRCIMDRTYAKRTPPCPAPAAELPKHADGIVQEVDLVSRVVHVLLPSGLQAVDVPPRCPVILHGEAVKLRLVQPGDRVRLAYLPRNSAFVATSLAIQP